MTKYEVIVFWGKEREQQVITVEAKDKQAAIEKASTFFWHNKDPAKFNVTGYAVREVA